MHQSMHQRRTNTHVSSTNLNKGSAQADDADWQSSIVNT